MCAVIGAILKEPSLEDFQNLERVFLESSIRGLHATGISYLQGDKIVTVKEPVHAKEFVEKYKLEDCLNEDGNLYLIGHCRYSTSDLKYNQPISNEQISVVHNGVITQELPENWEKLFGYKCETKNDTELLLHTIEDGKSPLEHWSDASISACVLSIDKSLKIFRNGKRPLYLTQFNNGYIVTSTMDIPTRAFGVSDTQEMPMDMYQSFHITSFGMKTFTETVITGNKDLQHVQQNRGNA